MAQKDLLSLLSPEDEARIANDPDFMQQLIRLGQGEGLIQSGHLPGPPAPAANREPAAAQFTPEQREFLKTQKHARGKAREDVKTIATESRPGVMTEENVNSLQGGFGKLVNEILTGIKKQDQGVENQMAALQQMDQLPRNVDLGPLMRLADSWYGSKMATGYKAPPTTREILSERLKKMNEIQGQRSKFSTAEIAALKALIGGSQQSGVTTTGSTEIGIQPPPPDRGRQGAQNSFDREFRRDTNKLETAYQEKMANFTQLARALVGDEKGEVNYGAIKSLLPNFHRNVIGDVGNTAVAEASRLDLPTIEKELESLYGWATSKTDRPINELNVENLRELVRSASAAWKKKHAAALKTVESNFSPFDGYSDSHRAVLKKMTVPEKSPSRKRYTREELQKMTPAQIKKALEEFKK
jgi:hypothetical protein